VPLHDQAVPKVKLPALKRKPRTENVTDKALWVPNTF
jgi:hypothetical protein